VGKQLTNSDTVFTTVNGRGAIPEDHPLAMGPLMGFQSLKAALGEADVIIAVGLAVTLLELLRPAIRRASRNHPSLT